MKKTTTKPVTPVVNKVKKVKDTNRINDLLKHLNQLESGMEVNHRSGKKGYQIRKALRKLGYYVSKN